MLTRAKAAALMIAMLGGADGVGGVGVDGGEIGGGSETGSEIGGS